MPAIIAGSDLRCSDAGFSPPRLKCGFRIGHRDCKIAAKTDQRLRAAIPDCLNRFDRVVALVAWRVESEDASYSVQKRIIRSLGNADRTVSLHIRVTAQRGNAGAFAPDIAAEQQQIGDLLHIAGTVTMLGDPHAVVDDDPLRLGVDIADGLDI